MTNFEELTAWLKDKQGGDVKNGQSMKQAPIVYFGDDYTSFQFCGWEIAFLADGTYYANDTTGG